MKRDTALSTLNTAGRSVASGNIIDWHRRFAELVSILRCPRCGRGVELESSGVCCGVCGKHYPLVDGVIQFVAAEGYSTSFGFEWSKYARTQLDDNGSRESEEAFRRKTGFAPEDLKGKWVLDVGCGMGRFAEVASRWGARVVGIDLSRAAQVAAQNLADRKNVWLCRSDLFALPFAPESFDYIYSLGVLHHTPNCEMAFKGLPRFLKAGGTIAIWIYSSYNNYYRMSDFYRRLTSRLPLHWLHSLCQVAGLLYYVHQGLRRLPMIGRIMSGTLSFLFPVSLHPLWKWRVLDTFDWYSPRFQSKHTYEEVFRWFEDFQLRELRVLFEPISVQGKKPGPASSEAAAGEPCLASEQVGIPSSSS